MKTLQVLLAMLLALLPLHAEESKSRTILILDASGSMWGQIEGTSKIEIARATAEDLITNRPDSLDMGLMAYGHRRKGDCQDIELIVPPGSATTERLLAALDQLIPKGKTPIYQSVLQAAESLRFTEEAASVILVSDGIETCGGDLDALGKLLAEQGVDFKTHIIGFAMADADTAQLRNLARATGGTYADAGDAAELKTALQSAVVAAVKAPTTVTLVPFGEDGKSVLRNGVEFALHADKSAENPSHSGRGGQFTTEVEPGSYLASATFSGRTLEQEIEILAESNNTFEFKFTAPVLSLRALLDEGGEPVTSGVSWSILGEPDAEGKRPQVGFSYDAQPQLRLAPGSYQVVARRGSAQVTKEVSFTDQPQTLSLIFGAGNLKVSAVLSEGGEPATSGISWRVLSEPDSEGERQQVAFSYDAQPQFTVPAGSYLVSAKRGNSAASKMVEVNAGTLTTEQIVLGSGILSAKMIMAPGLKPHTGSGLSWSILGQPNAEGKRPQLGFSYEGQPEWTLPSGEITVVVKRGSATASQDLEIVPGKRSEIVINLNAALVKARMAMSEGAELHQGGGLSWSVLAPANTEGKRPQVSFSYEGQPTFCLPVGKYTVAVKRGSASAEQDIEVIAGQHDELTLIAHAGLLKPKVVMVAGGEFVTGGGLSWSVLGDPDAQGKRPQIAFSYEAQPTFSLPLGRYTVQVTRGSATGSQEIEVEPGPLNEAVFDLNAGLIKVILADASGQPITPGSVSWSVYDATDEEGKKITFSYDKVPTFILPAGSYSFEAGFDGKKVATTATVPPGKLTEFTMKIAD